MTDGNRYNRIPKDTTAAKKRLLAIRQGQQKDTNSHGKLRPNKSNINRCIQRSIRDAIALGWSETKGGSSVYIVNPSHHIHTLIHTLPKTHTTAVDEDADNDVHTPLKFPAWRNLHSEIAKPYFYQLALSELETLSDHEYRLIPFVFNESTALTAAIERQKLDRVAYLRDRLQKALNEALQRPKDSQVAFWFAFETARRGQPHIQGSLLIRPDEARKAMRAFYKVNREMTPDELRGALRFRSGKRKRLSEERGNLYTDLNWADYNLKERATTRMEYANLGNIVAASQPLIKATEDYYSAFRAGLNSRQKAAKSIRNTKAQHK
jgi:hypothetical protein